MQPQFHSVSAAAQPCGTSSGCVKHHEDSVVSLVLWPSPDSEVGTAASASPHGICYTVRTALWPRSPHCEDGAAAWAPHPTMLCRISPTLSLPAAQTNVQRTQWAQLKISRSRCLWTDVCVSGLLGELGWILGGVGRVRRVRHIGAGLGGWDMCVYLCVCVCVFFCGLWVWRWIQEVGVESVWWLCGCAWVRVCERLCGEGRESACVVCLCQRFVSMATSHGILIAISTCHSRDTLSIHSPLKDPI